MHSKYQLIRDLIFLILILIALYLIFFRPEKPTKEYWENSNFKTDTVIVSFDYSKVKMPDFKFNVPPVKIIQYQTTPAPHVSITMDDSLITVIDSLTNKITTINALYLKLYPDAPKLIYGNFTADTIQVDLLDKSGSISTSKVAVNYARFQYQFKDNTFRAQELRQNPLSKDLRGVLFGYAGYDLISTSPIVGADYSIFKGRFRLQANSLITIQQQPTGYIGGTIGFKLYGGN